MTNWQQFSKLIVYLCLKKIEFSHKMAIIERERKKEKRIKADTHQFSKMAFIQMDIKIVFQHLTTSTKYTTNVQHETCKCDV